MNRRLFYARWRRADLAAIAGVPYTIPIETAAALLGETVEEITDRILRGELFVAEDDWGTNGPIAAQFLKKEGYRTNNPPQMLRAGRLLPRPTFHPDDLKKRADASGNLSLGDVTGLTGQTVTEIVADAKARRLAAEHDRQTGWVFPSAQFTSDYTVYPD